MLKIGMHLGRKHVIYEMKKMSAQYERKNATNKIPVTHGPCYHSYNERNARITLIMVRINLSRLEAFAW